MKLAKEFKTVGFHGIKLVIHSDHVAVAVDEDGECWSYAVIPEAKGISFNPYKEFFWTAGSVHCQLLASIDLEGMDWKDSMIVYGCAK